MRGRRTPEEKEVTRIPWTPFKGMTPVTQRPLPRHTSCRPPPSYSTTTKDNETLYTWPFKIQATGRYDLSEKQLDTVFLKSCKCPDSNMISPLKATMTVVTKPAEFIPVPLKNQKQSQGLLLREWNPTFWFSPTDTGQYLNSRFWKPANGTRGAHGCFLKVLWRTNSPTVPSGEAGFLIKKSEQHNTQRLPRGQQSIISPSTVGNTSRGRKSVYFHFKSTIPIIFLKTFPT